MPHLLKKKLNLVALHFLAGNFLLSPHLLLLAEKKANCCENQQTHAREMVGSFKLLTCRSSMWKSICWGRVLCSSTFCMGWKQVRTRPFVLNVFVKCNTFSVLYSNMNVPALRIYSYCTGFLTSIIYFGKANYTGYMNVVSSKSSKWKTRSVFYYLFLPLQTFLLYKYYPSTLQMSFQIFRE